MATAVDEFRQRLGASIRQMLGGEAEPRRVDLSAEGLFGPESAIWQVHGDASMLVGGVRALLVQTLHPPTMAGVADHSDYRTDPLGRLQRTGQYVGHTTFGSVEEAEQVIARVKSIHRRVQGTAPDGTPYSAGDPHLLNWVHSTEVDSFLAAHQHFGAEKLTPRRADRYVEEMSEIGRRMGIAQPPTTVAELDETLRGYLPELGVNHQTREALRFLTFPPLALAARGPYAVLLGGAVSILPGWARRRLWLPPLPVTERLAVRPAAMVLTRGLGWVMQPRR